jgi:hypothetical protein
VALHALAGKKAGQRLSQWNTKTIGKAIFEYCGWVWVGGWVCIQNRKVQNSLRSVGNLLREAKQFPPPLRSKKWFLILDTPERVDSEKRIYRVDHKVGQFFFFKDSNFQIVRVFCAIKFFFLIFDTI